MAHIDPWHTALSPSQPPCPPCSYCSPYTRTGRASTKSFSAAISNLDSARLCMMWSISWDKLGLMVMAALAVHPDKPHLPILHHVPNSLLTPPPVRRNPAGSRRAAVLPASSARQELATASQVRVPLAPGALSGAERYPEWSEENRPHLVEHESSRSDGSVGPQSPAAPHVQPPRCRRCIPWLRQRPTRRAHSLQRAPPLKGALAARRTPLQ